MNRILILSDDAFSLRRFRRELVATMLASRMEVILGIPAGEDAAALESLGCQLIDINTQKAKSKQKRHTRRYAFFVAGVAGFEPTNARVKVSCLTAWLHPIE